MIKYDFTKKCCATCESWAGEREVLSDGVTVASFDVTGICYKENVCSACVGHSAGERENCAGYKRVK